MDGHRVTSVQGGAEDVGHLVGEHVQQCLARSQALHRAQIVVQRIGVGAVGVQGESAVEAVQGGGAVRQPVEQAAQDAERVGRDGQRARGGEPDVFRDVAGAGELARFLKAADGHGQGIASGAAAVVRHRVGKGVGERLARLQRLHGGQVVVQGIEVRAVRIHRQGAVGSGSGRLGDEGHGVMGVRVPWGGQASAGGDLGVLGDGGCRRRYGGRVVGAVDGHGQGVGADAAVLILDGIGKDFLKGFPDSQTLHDGKAVVQGVGVTPGGVHDQRAVDALHGGGHEGEDVADHAVLGVVGIGRRGKRAARHRRGVFRDLDGGRSGQRRVVGAVDGDGQRAGRSRAVVVRDRIGEGVGQRFARGQALYRAEAVVEGIEPRAVGVEGQGAVQPRLGHLGRIGQHIGARSVQGIVRIRRGQPARGREHGVFLDRASAGRGRGGVVGALDGDGQGVVAHRAVAVFHGVQEHFGQRVAHAEPLYGGQIVVEDIGIGTVGVEGQGAVASRFTRFGDEGHGIVGVDVLRRRQGAARRGSRVFRHGGGGGGDHRGVVGPGDGYGERVGRRAALAVGDGVGEDVGERFARAERLNRSQRVVEGVDIGAVCIEGQGAVGPGPGDLGNEAQRVAGDAVRAVVDVRGRGQLACGGQLGVFRHGGDGGGDRRGVVGAVDDYGQDIGSRAAVPVADRVGKDVPERFALPEPLHGVHGVVERIGIGAVRPQGQASVQPGFRRFGHEHGYVMGVGIRGRGQGAVEHGQRVFRHESERRADRGGIVGTVDGQGQGVGRRAAVPVADGVGKGVGEGFAHAECLHGGQGVVEGVGVRAVGIERQASVQPGLRRFGYEYGRVMGVRVRGRGQDSGRGQLDVFLDAVRRRSHGGRVVGTVDGQGQGVGRRAAVPVADGVGKGVGEGFAHAECLHGGQGVVEGVGVRAVGIERQASVQPGLRRFGYEYGRVMGVRVRGRGQGAGGGQPGIFGDGSGCGGDGRRVVGAVDGYGQGA